MSTTRMNRYQEGSIARVSRAKGPAVWVYRWRETGANGKRVQRKQVIGDVNRYPTAASAKRAVEQLRIQINAAEDRVGKPTVLKAWEHFQAHELRNPEIDRSPTTIELYLDNFRAHILPRWGHLLLTEVKAVQVEAWLGGLKLAPATKSKLRNNLSALFSHSIRHELYDRLNPISAVRQSAKRQTVPDILTVAEIGTIIARLKAPSTRTMVLIAAVTGLRRSEIRGLKWCDVDLEALWFRLRRGKVRTYETKLKTEASRKGVPICQELADALRVWRCECLYRAESDWVFASPEVGGRQPMWLDIVLRNQIRPAAAAARITKVIGWHTFRRSLSTALSESNEPVKVVSELLRHAKHVHNIRALSAGKRRLPASRPSTYERALRSLNQARNDHSALLKRRAFLCCCEENTAGLKSLCALSVPSFGRISASTRCSQVFHLRGFERWWAQQDSNLRLPPCEGEERVAG